MRKILISKTYRIGNRKFRFVVENGERILEISDSIGMNDGEWKTARIKFRDEEEWDLFRGMIIETNIIFETNNIIGIE